MTAWERVWDGVQRVICHYFTVAKKSKKAQKSKKKSKGNPWRRFKCGDRSFGYRVSRLKDAATSTGWRTDFAVHPGIGEGVISIFRRNLITVAGVIYAGWQILDRVLFLRFSYSDGYFTVGIFPR